MQGNRLLPTRAVLRSEGLFLALRDIAAEQLQDAFMQETVARLAGATESFAQVERADLGKAGPASAPAGMIFHVARCGSTLISQLLKQHDGLVVYSEPLPFNELLLPPHVLPRQEIVAALRSLGDAFARHAGRPYVLKLSSWNTLFCDLLAEAFPESPWILNVRDPVEVGVSLLDRPAGWMQGHIGPAAELRRCVDPQGISDSREDFVARLYAAFCSAAARLDSAHGKLLRYETLPAAVWEDLAPHFALQVDDALRERMVQAARSNSKAPVGTAAEFASDESKKQESASPALRHAMGTLADPALRRLEQIYGTRA